ncbi:MULTISPECIES: hypothetical protein [Providencia]|uniref:hypothetical protein n=1 Tax=Providencia TaxID=586 RepID=UPI001BAA04B8|nr:MULTISPECIES: hypothetical protein [Providencia]EIU7558839.1 hypothetical protein [Providencia rettgeri]ELR5208919.1 hypothetical protein [Providencia rettgeri]ELT5686084.1 hypothetical protein [Providencia rettgeri]MBS0916999.1 hypothetical protein [Providencia rettgeri]MCB4842768.1 hypothetical protein [Providencia rettgeri]
MSRITMSTLALTMSVLIAQSASWAVNHNNHWYSYPLSNKRITGHAKINRAARKRRGRK